MILTKNKKNTTSIKFIDKLLKSNISIEDLISLSVLEIFVEPRLLSTSPAYGHVYFKNEWIINN